MQQMPNTKGYKASFGSLRKLPSGRIQARYTGPDGISYRAPVTFDTKGDAKSWLATVRADLVRGAWQPPNRTGPSLSFAEYAEVWLKDRTLKPRTRELYRQLLERRLLPTFGALALPAISPALVRKWHADTGDTAATARAHAYGLLKAILTTAVSDDLIAANPCRIRGAGTAKRRHQIKPASLAEIEALVVAMPPRYKAAVLLSAWCGLRFGELIELRRKDVDRTEGVLHVRRAVARVSGEPVVGTPKSDAGTRNVAVPPHLMPMLKRHMLEHAAPGKDGLLFPAVAGGHLSPSTLYKVFAPAREAAGRPDLRWHDLRHTGAVLAASTGATLAELMGRLGHSTPGAALRYQHAAEGRDMAIARALSAMVERPASITNE
jgi:integrase